MVDDDADDAFQRLRSSMVLDTRPSQSLEPIRLPGKLRDRIEQAQRRAATAKDGVSIFASSTERMDSSLLLSPQGATSVSATAGHSQTAPNCTSNSSLTRTSSLGADGVLALAKDKTRLPEVVLSHKMRDFEAKTYTNSLLADPLDNTFSKLTIEEKERVMVRMQEKIQLLTSEIDDNFVKIKHDLDANVCIDACLFEKKEFVHTKALTCLLCCWQGIFDSAANYQRAQALCLVELQKRCKLELLRDEAIDEVIGAQLSHLIPKKSKRSTRMSGKLSILLTHSTNQADHDDSERPGGKSALQARTGPHHGAKKKTATPNRQHVKRLPTLLGTTNPQQGNDSNQIKKETDEHSKVQDRSRPLSSSSSQQQQRSNSPSARREDRVERGVSKDDPSAVSGGDRGGDAMASRHPHIAQVLQQLAYLHDGANVKSLSGGRISKSSHVRFPAIGNNTSVMGLNDMDESRLRCTEEQWRDRSNSYRTIASRVTEVLQNRSERQRWDAMGHFGFGLRDAPISESLMRKVASQHHRRLTIIPSGNGEKHARDDDNNSDSSSVSRDDDGTSHRDTLESQTRMQQEYARIQDQIRTRLQREKGKKTAFAKASQGTKALNQVAATKSIAHRGPQGASNLLGRQEQRAAAPSTATTQGGNNSLSSSSSNAIASLGITSSAVGQVHDSSTVLSANENTLMPPPGTPSLGVSCSAPEFQALKSTDPRQCLGRSAMELVYGRDGARNSLLQRSTMSIRRNTVNRLRRLQKESLIGAPAVTNFSTIGHHSHARMEERRNAAQTWAWYHPSPLTHKNHQFAPGGHGPETHNLDEDEEDEDGDTFQDAIDEEEEGEMDDATSRTHDDHDGDFGTNDTASSVSFLTSFAPDSARSARSVATLVHAATSARRKKLKRRQPGRLHHHQSGSGNNLYHSIGHASASSMALQLRLEEIWRALEFPFSTKLLMLEKYADIQDPDTFQTALLKWEKAAEAVLVRERMKSALSTFAEHGNDVNALVPCQLTGPEWMYVRSLQIETPADHLLHALPLEAFIDWIRTHMDVITSKCQQFAHELKATTGDELLFQGCTYPPRTH